MFFGSFLVYKKIIIKTIKDYLFRMKINAKKDMMFQRPRVIIIKCKFLSLKDNVYIKKIKVQECEKYNKLNSTQSTQKNVKLFDNVLILKRRNF